MTRSRLSRRKVLALGLGAGAGLAVAGWSQVGNRDDLRVERHNLRLPRWDADGFTIAFLADLHIDNLAKARLAEVAVEAALAARPDVVLIGGDSCTTSDRRRLDHLVDVFSRFEGAPVPVLAVMGNHEYGTNAPTKVMEALRRTPIRVLRNELVEVGGVTIVGIDDGIARRDRHDLLSPRNDRNVVAMFHEPDFVDRIDRRSSLMLAGHSHGGQVCLPFGIPLHTPFGAREYIKGFYRQAPVPLYVTRGVGTVGPRARAFCPPEVSILTLNS